jgi:selenocysteine lyase/cysteine desulfurase
LTQMLRDRIAPAGFEFLSPTEEKNRCGILTFRHPQIATERFANAITKKDIVVSLRYDRVNRGWLRVSPHFYNTAAEMAKIAELLIQGSRA